MSTDFEYRSGDQAAPGSVAQIPLFLGTCADGELGRSYTFDAGDDVAGDLGPGKVSALAIAHGAIGSCVVAPVACTYPALPAVTKTGNGPSIAVALIEAGSGPHDDANLKLTVTADATRMDVSYDGTSVAETIIIPPEGPAVLTGTVAITPAVLGKLSDPTGLHLDYTAPSSATLTFPDGSLVGSGAGLKAATATVAAPVTLTSSDLLAPGKAVLAANPRRVTFKTAGALATDAPATATIVGTGYDGGALSETVNLSQTAGTVASVNAYATIASITYAAADGTGATVAIGYAAAYADPDEVASAFNALAEAAGLAVRARIAQTLAGSFLQTYTTDVGASITQTIDDGASSADTLFGFASGSNNLTATGTHATRVFEWLGVTVTFPAGPYTAGTYYTIPLRGPRGAVGDYVDALNAAIVDYQDHPFGYVVVCEDPATNANARAIYDALRQIAATKRHDPDDPVLFDVVTPTALHAADPDKATNDAAITAWETDLAAAFAGAAASLESIAVDDCWVAGPPRMPGLFRRPTSWAAAFKRSSLDRIGGNPCDGRAPLVSLAGPDGTRARDEAKRSTKLAGLAGPGFWCLKSMQGGGVKFAPSASRAGSLDRYRNPGVVAFALEASRRVLPQLQAWEGTWETDPENPKAADPDLLEHRAGILTTLIDPVAFPPNEPKNVSAYTVKLTAPTILDDGQATVFIDFNPLAVAEKVRAILTATGVTLETPGA